MTATILTKSSDTATSVPLNTDLTKNSGGAELAVNTADQKLYVKNSSNAVVEISPVLKAHPIGSVFLSITDDTEAKVQTSCGGGSWSRIAEGKMLIGQQTSDSDFATAEQNGGSKTVTLSTDNLPAHTHDILSATATDVEVIGSSETNIREIRDNSVRSATTTDATESTGSGTAFNNMNPYFVVYMWKRTA